MINATATMPRATLDEWWQILCNSTVPLPTTSANYDQPKVKKNDDLLIFFQCQNLNIVQVNAAEIVVCHRSNRFF